MKIKYDKEDTPQKLWHRKPGDVVRLYHDGELSDHSYLILEQQHSKTILFDLINNLSCMKSCSVRCVRYPDAELKLGKSKP